MNIPAFKPRYPRRQANTYAERVARYGAAPKGYRWLKVGKVINEGTLRLEWYHKQWGHALSIGERVDECHMAMIAPLPAKPVPSPAPDTNLLNRLDALRAKIAASQKLIVAESERLDKYAEILKSLEEIK